MVRLCVWLVFAHVANVSEVVAVAAVATTSSAWAVWAFKSTHSLNKLLVGLWAATEFTVYAAGLLTLLVGNLVFT
jgi:hypothetical protein